MHVQSRTLQFNLNGLHQSQSWGKSILNWSESQRYLRWHCIVYTCWLSAPDATKHIWLNDITFERITTLTCQLSSLSFLLFRFFYATGFWPKAKRREVQSAGGKIHTHLLRSHHTHQCKNSYNPTNVCVPVNSSSHWDKSVLIRKWKCKHTLSDCVWVTEEELKRKGDDGKLVRGRKHKHTHTSNLHEWIIYL